MRPLIDTCVHHRWRSQDELIPYLSRGWREYLEQPRRLSGGGTIPVLPAVPYHRPDGARLPESEPDGATTCEQLAEQLLDRFDVRRAVLTHDFAMFSPARANPRLAVAVARALNDWTADRWLRHDERLRALLVVPNQTPEDAVAELERLGDEPGFCGVLMAGNGIGKPFGHPLYHPIYAAAAERGLPVVIRPGGDALAESLTHATAGGVPATYAEYAILAPQAVMTHLTSIVGQGVLEKLPSLRILVAGAGVAWLPSLFWRFDTEYRTYRRETPWVKRMPSEYLRDRIRLTTYPLDVTPRPEQLVRLLDAFGGLEDVLMFGSGYPNWDTDWPTDLDDRLPEGWRSKVFHDNAHELFGDR